MKLIADKNNNDGTIYISGGNGLIELNIIEIKNLKELEY